jgi:hypothetical protein
MDRGNSVSRAVPSRTVLRRSGARRLVPFLLLAPLWFGLAGCTSTEIGESPKTGYAAEIGEPKTPEIVWTSRTLTQAFDYLGQVRVRSWTYNGAIERLLDGGKQLRADAIVDIHYERIGFFNSMTAFAIKYR